MTETRLSQFVGHLIPPRGYLTGQTAIVTGAGQGIGAAIAEFFFNEGAKVVISDIDAGKAKAVADKLNALNNGKALAVPGDITDANTTRRLVQEAAKFGNGKLHIIVNNAGYTWDAVVHKTSDKQWEAMVAIHGTAPFRIIREAAPYFRVKDGEPRSIVNISSASGIHGAAVSFGAVQTRLTTGKDKGNSITLSDGTEVALGIPGATEKSSTGNRYADIPLQRAATPFEAAATVLAIVSPLMSYVDGQTIEVTGGKWI
ncbi:putative secondary metabolism biosynthetic enzyme [Exophiala oligosperma]